MPSIVRAVAIVVMVVGWCLVLAAPCLATAPDPTVTLEPNPSEDLPLVRLHGQSFTLVATGDPGLDGETAEEVANGQATVTETYEWDYAPATCTTLPANGYTESFNYATGTTPDYYAVSVTYKVTVTYADHTSEPEQSATASVEIVLCKLTGLQITGQAYQIGQTDDWATAIQSGQNVTIAAVVEPGLDLERVGDLLSWSGGTAVSGDDFRRTQSRGTKGTYHISVTLGADTCACDIIVCEITGIDVVSGATKVTGSPDAITAADPDDTGGVILEAVLDPVLTSVPQHLLLWAGGTDVADHPERHKVLKTQPEKQYAKCICGSTSAEISVWPVALEITVAGGSDEDPAKVVINNDDDDENSTEDKNETDVEGENDLISAHVRLRPSDLPGGSLSVTCTEGIALWVDSNKATEPPTAWDLSEDSIPMLHMEGLAVTEPEEETVTATFTWGEAVSLEDEAPVVVIPRYGDSEAWLVNCTDSAMTNEKLAPIGGTCYPVLYVKVGGGERINSSTTSVTVRVHDDYDDYETGTIVDKDWAVNLASATGWEMRNPQKQWVTATQAPTTDNRDGPTALCYRYKLTWDTTCEPTEGNGEHDLTAFASVGDPPSPSPILFERYEDQEWQDPFDGGPRTQKTDVENVVVTNAKASEGNEDFLKYDPGAPEESALRRPSVTFTVQDDGDPHKYMCVLYLRSTNTRDWNYQGESGFDPESGTTYVCETRNQPETVTITWNGGAPGGAPDTYAKGTYTFEVGVFEYVDTYSVENIIDANYLKWPCDLYVPDTVVVQEETVPGHEAFFFSTDAGREMRVKWQLNDDHRDGNNNPDRPAEKADVVVVNPDLRTVASTPVSKQIYQYFQGVDENNDDTTDGISVYQRQLEDREDAPWYIVWTGTDACGVHSPFRRDHSNPRMLAVNAEPKPKYAVYAWGTDPLQTCGINTAGKIDQTACFERYALEYPPSSPKLMRNGLQECALVFLTMHGSTYEPLTANGDTDDASEGPNKRHGDSVISRDSLGAHHALSTYTATALRYHNANDFYTYALVGDGTQYIVDNERILEREGLTNWNNTCQLLFVAACNSFHSWNSFAGVAKYKKVAAHTIGYSRTMNATLSADFCGYFWERFRQKSWSSGLDYAKVSDCWSGAKQDFWGKYEPMYYNAYVNLMFDASDHLDINGIFTYCQ